MVDLPLSGVRVVDLAHGNADLVSRFWADLGADVRKVESAPPSGGAALPYRLDNANKQMVRLDPAVECDRNRFADLVANADIVVDSGIPGRLTVWGTTGAVLADLHPRLVVMSVSDFGLEGPKAGWVATDAQLCALSTALSRSRGGGGEPSLPPAGIADASAAAQAAWAGLAAYYRRLRCGRGEFIDFSRHEAVLQSLDPPFGSQGQAAAARGSSPARRTGTVRQDPYPIVGCRDGWVRLCVLAPRQWRGLRAWLGEPEAFQDPKYDAIGVRFAAWDQIGHLVTTRFADQTRDELLDAAAQFGVPAAALATPDEVFSIEHFQQTGAFVDIEMDSEAVEVPNGCLHIDGVRAGIRGLAGSESTPGASSWQTPSPEHRADPTVERPFSGLRVLDLGVIVAGGELGRLFSDLGAEVIKVESVQYPDGLRQGKPGQQMSESFAWTHRNQSSLGLNLRDPAGAAAFRRLVTVSDLVLANFKPGTLDKLGLSFADLAAANPRIVLAESSAYGENGPWSARMGYGPLVRASTGITTLWTGRDAAGNSLFCDATTVFPDHVVARITATAALALLIRRLRTGVGGRVHVSQAEAAIGQLQHVYAAASARRRGLAAPVQTCTHDVSPALGEDQWCVTSIRDEADWETLGILLGAPSRTAEDREQLRHALRKWLSDKDCHIAAASLQEAGLPAAPMYRAADVLADPHVRHRQMYNDLVHPLLDAVLPTETAPARYRTIPRAELGPAPLTGEDTRRICRDILGYDDEQIDKLIDAGVLTEAMVEYQQESAP